MTKVIAPIIRTTPEGTRESYEYYKFRSVYGSRTIDIRYAKYNDRRYRDAKDAKALLMSLPEEYRSKYCVVAVEVYEYFDKDGRFLKREVYESPMDLDSIW